MSKREEILNIVKEGNLEDFVQFVRTCKKDGSDITEIISGCSKKQFDELWDGTQKTCTTTLLNLQIGDDEVDNEEAVETEFKKVTDVLDCVVNLALSTIRQENVYIPGSLLSTAVVLHGLLLPIPEKADPLKNNIVKLFEEWWKNSLPGKENLVTSTFIYLLQRSIQTKTVADVKRVWSLHEVLLAVDLSNESSESLKDLIQQCTFSVNYLKSEEGIRFLGFVMSLDMQLTESLHKTIKNHIPTTSRSWLEKYGEIYFRAWQRSSGALTEKIETYCIQDLMYHAIHAKDSLAPSLLKVLSYIHKQKMQKGVNEMLLKLYDPILWRSLKVANGHVRANAASLLNDVFPLQDSAAKLEESDQLLQKQFDVLQTLLDDPYPFVRSITILGLFRIMSKYWEMIPPNTLKNIITKMIKESVWDSTSADVRGSVIKGLTILLDNHLCHSLLAPVLPELRNFIHDVSEKVRIAMVVLLQKVKGMRTIKLWNIVPIEHLLARLEIDTPPVGRRITKLIVNNFLPFDKPAEIQLDRCIKLIETNPGAARQFFHYALHHMSIQEACNYITLLCSCILTCIKSKDQNEEKQEDNENKTRKRSKSQSSEDDEDAGDSLMHKTKVVAGIVEAIVILWTGIYESLLKEGNKELRKSLQKKFSLALPEMFKSFEDPQICTALILLAGHVQSDAVPTIRRTCLSKLRNMSEDNSVNDYGCLLEAMCNWGKAGEVFDLAEEWLQEGLTETSNNQPVTKSGKKSRKQVGFVDLKRPQPLLGIKYISYMIKLQKVISDHQDKLIHTRDILKRVMERIEHVQKTEDSAEIDEQLLTESFSLYCKIIVILHEENAEENGTIQTYEQILSWATNNLIPVLQQKEDVDLQTGKRPISDVSQCSLELASELIKILLSISSNLLLLDIGDLDFASHLTDFCTECLNSDESLITLPNVLNCMYQITEYILLCNHTGSHGNLIPEFLGKALVSIAAYVNRKKEHSVKLLLNIKGVVFEILTALYRNTSSEIPGLQETMATILAAVLSDMSNSSSKRELNEGSSNFQDLPILSRWLCENIYRKKSITVHFVKELCTCVESGAITDVHNLNGAVCLLGVLSHGKFKIPGLKDCWTAVQIQYEKLKQSGHEDDDDTNSDVMKDIASTLKECQQTLDMVPV